MARVEYRYMGATLQNKRGDIRGLEFAVVNDGGTEVYAWGWIVLDRRIPIVLSARGDWLSESAEVWVDALEFT